VNIGKVEFEQRGDGAAGNGFDARASMDALAKLQNASDGRKRRELAAFYRDAARKRSPEYMKNLSKLVKLRAERDRILAGDEAKAGNSSEENYETNAALETSPNESAENLQKTKEIKTLEEIDKEIEEVGRDLEKEMPQGSFFLTLIFWSIYQDVLAQQGIISPGEHEAYTDVEELIKRCGAENNEKAREQLRRGDSVLRNEGAGCMAVEIYLDAICVIYPDGAVKVLRGDPDLGV